MYPITTKDRIRNLVSYLGISAREFQRVIGVANGFLSGNSEPAASALAEIVSNYPQVSPEWLLTGNGSMLRDLSIMSEGTTATDDESPAVVNEPTKSYHGVKSPDITLPLRVYEELLHQLKVKDQQLEDAAAQIRTLFEMLNK